VRGTAKICDYGISKIVSTLDPTSNAFVGTPNWMAPEVINNLEYDSKVDIYSFGMVLFELCTKTVPWGNLALIQIGIKVVNGTRPVISSSVPTQWRELIISCWKQEPNERPTAQKLIQDLDNLPLFGISESDQILTDVAEKKRKEEIERKLKEEAYMTRLKEEAEKRKREETERKLREAEMKKLTDEVEKRLKEEAEKKNREETERKLKVEAEKRKREETERKLREAEMKRLTDEVEKGLKEEVEKKNREETERNLKVEAEKRKPYVIPYTFIEKLEYAVKGGALKPGSGKFVSKPEPVPVKPEPVPVKPAPVKPASIKRVVALLDYPSEYIDELSFLQGDLITVLEENTTHAGMWYGELRGITGYFPTSFVDSLPEEKIVTAIYDYTADSDVELSFSKGDTIILLKKNLNGWWEGEYYGRRGLFPSVFVQEIV